MTFPCTMDGYESLAPADDAYRPEPIAPDTVPLERLPDSVTLAGMPLRHLLDDASGPGAVLRDRFTIHPY